MANRMQLAELDLKIEKLRTALEALRIGKASGAEIDAALSELARARADRTRLMLRQVSIRTKRAPHQAPGTIGRSDRVADQSRLASLADTNNASAVCLDRGKKP